MAETIETFVARLQEEGVQAGQQAAEKLTTDARQQAEQIIADANKQAEQIKADAEKQAEQTLQRSRNELELAARDTVAKLRAALTDALNAVLAEGAKNTLSDLAFLGEALHKIVEAYTQADLQHKLSIDINVPGELQGKLTDWAFKEIKDAVAQVHPTIDLHGRLRKVGFEYSVEDNGTVEVTLDSVVETLSQMVTPRLREVLENAANASDSSS